MLFSINSYSQKSVYDVVPGSGPAKKKSSSGSVYDVTRTPSHRSHGKKYRRNLPPGQAKKIYGGSATDYAPGQVKKRHHKHKHHGKHKD